MFDIGWSELVLIGFVALVVVGPKELPGMFRTLGRLVAKGRMMARDFQRAMEDAADTSGMKDIQRDLNAIRTPMQSGLDVVNRKLDDWDERARAARTKPATDAMTPPVAANGAAPPAAPTAAPTSAPVEMPVDQPAVQAGPPPELRTSAPTPPPPVQQPAAPGLPGDENKA